MGIRNREAEEARVRTTVEELCARLDLGWLTVQNEFDASKGSEDAAARIICVATADWEYRQVTLRWTLIHAITVTDDELRATAVHELVHALIAPLYEELSDKVKLRLHKNNELATENVARAILAAL